MGLWWTPSIGLTSLAAWRIFLEPSKVRLSSCTSWSHSSLLWCFRAFWQSCRAWKYLYFEYWHVHVAQRRPELWQISRFPHFQRGNLTKFENQLKMAIFFRFFFFFNLDLNIMSIRGGFSGFKKKYFFFYFSLLLYRDFTHMSVSFILTPSINENFCYLLIFF